VPTIGIEIHGRTGRLRSGCRLVATFGAWEGRDLPGHRRMRVAVAVVHRNVVWWGQHTGPLTADLDVGSQVWRGTATIVREEPLDLIVEEIDLA